MRAKPPRVPDRVLRQPEPTRARYPDRHGFVERDGVRLYYEVHGSGDPTLLLVPCVGGADARSWKAQVPYLARQHRVVVYDPRGRARSDQPRGPAAYTVDEHLLDALAVLEVTDTDRALVVSHCVGARPALRLITSHPDRAAGAAFISPYLYLTRWPPVETYWRTFEVAGAARRAAHVCRGILASAPLVLRSRSLRRFARRVKWFEADRFYTAAHMLRDQRGFLEWNARVLEIPEPHSTRQIEDAVDWALETDPRVQVDALLGIDVRDRAFQNARAVRQLCGDVCCPVLVIHGDENLACPVEWGDALATATGGTLAVLPRVGHVPQARKPVAVNLELRRFAERVRAEERSDRPVAGASDAA